MTKSILVLANQPEPKLKIYSEFNGSKEGNILEEFLKYNKTAKIQQMLSGITVISFTNKHGEESFIDFHSGLEVVFLTVNEKMHVITYDSYDYLVSMKRNYGITTDREDFADYKIEYFLPEINTAINIEEK